MSDIEVAVSARAAVSGIPDALKVPSGDAGSRLDVVLARLIPDISRARLQRWIKEGAITLQGARCKPGDIVQGGETVELRVEREPVLSDRPQAITLNVVHEDEDIIVLDKPPGLVVHPAAGNWDGTLLNALLHHRPGMAELPRAGIVHRLDKDTSGIMVVAKSLQAHQALVQQLAAREVKREYVALVWGQLERSGKVDAPIGRHPVDRKRMAVVASGREAVTHFYPAAGFPGVTLVRVRLQTGRTHQIRVHMTHIRHPIVGDRVYGGRHRATPGLPQQLRDRLLAFPRQALHAERLTLVHPVSGEELSWQVPMPDDMLSLLEALQASKPTEFQEL